MLLVDTVRAPLLVVRMPLDTIYLTRHGVNPLPLSHEAETDTIQHRLNWTIDLRTGVYKSQFPTPTGSPVDPSLTSHGVRQSLELAAHLSSREFAPKPWRIYSSPFYRCLQTIQPSVEALQAGPKDDGVELNVRLENGLGHVRSSASRLPI